MKSIDGESKEDNEAADNVGSFVRLRRLFREYFGRERLFSSKYVVSYRG